MYRGSKTLINLRVFGDVQLSLNTKQHFYLTKIYETKTMPNNPNVKLRQYI